MSAGALVGVVMVPFIGATMCVAPAINRPTVAFGVRVPAEHARAPVVRQQRRAYYARTAAIGICCTVAVVLLRDYGSWWLSRLILLLEVAGNLACYWIARKKITAVKQAENWYAGHRQVVATDTSWRSDPPRFPVPWLIPALAVIAATVIAGAVLYPGLPAHLTGGFGHHQVPKSLVSVFTIVVAQVYVTVLWTGLMLIVYRSRPDVEAADPAASTGRYRRALAAVTRAVLALLALVDLSLLLAGLRQWQVIRPSGPGSALPIVPVVIGLVILAAVSIHVGQGGSRLSGAGAGAGPSAPAATDRDDDRFWKAGLIYYNRDDPAIMVSARIGVGWTFNLANPMAWLVLAGILALPAGLIALAATAGL